MEELKSEGRGGGPTVIYHVGHYGYLWRFLVHKAMHHPNESAIFLVNEAVCSPETREFLYSRAEDTRFGRLRTFVEPMRMDVSSEEEYEDGICAIFDSLLDELGCDLQPCKVYTGFDVFTTFTVYLSIRKKHFTLCDGGMFRIDRMGEYDGELNKRRASPIFLSIVKRHRGITWDNAYVTDVIWFRILDGSKGAFSPPEIPKPSEVICCEDALGEMPQGDRDRILSYFNAPSIPTLRSTLLISSSDGISKTPMTKGMMAAMYSHVVDYFIGSLDDVVLKPHPNMDFSEQWAALFPGHPVIKGYVPSQIMDYIPNLSPSTIVTTSETGMPNENALRPMLLTQQAIQAHMAYHKLFVTMSIIRTMGERVRLDIRLGDLMPFCRAFMEFLFPDLLGLVDTPDAEVVAKVVDDTYTGPFDASSELTRDSVVFRLDSKGSTYLDLQAIRSCLPLYIRKDMAGTGLVGMGVSEAHESIRVYSASGSRLNALRGYVQSYSLGCSGMTVSVSSVPHSPGSNPVEHLVSSRFKGKPVVLVVTDGADAAYSQDVLLAMGARPHKVVVDGSGDSLLRHAFTVFGAGFDPDRLSEISRELEMEPFSDYLAIDAHVIGRLPGFNRHGDLEHAIARAFVDYGSNDVPRAVGHIREAISRRRTDAREMDLADLLMRDQLPESLAEAHAICSRLAGSGSAGAMARLGRMHRDGLHVGVDPDEAIRWMRMAVEKEADWAKDDLIRMLMSRSSQSDLREAHEMVSELVLRGDTWAMIVLGRMHRDGLHVGVDPGEAIEIGRASCRERV